MQGSGRVLHHLWLSAPSRAARIALKEKGIEAETRIERVWERRPEFLALNPAGETPALVEPDGAVICGAGPICEYLEEIAPERPLLPGGALARAEIRRLAAWFHEKFAREVTNNLVEEKVTKRFLALGEPSSAAIRAGHANIRYHLDYVAYLVERRKFLAGDDFSLADVAAAAHLSAIDYLGDVPWEQHEPAKLWYMRIKSRPSVRPLLADVIPGIPPPKHYADLDF